MRIAIDMQGAQASSALRGIGRYTMALSQAMARLRDDHEVLLILNGMLPDYLERIRTAFDQIVPQENIKVWNAEGGVEFLDHANESRRRRAEMMREAFIAQFSPDIVLIVSLFEGLGDNTVTSIGSFSKEIPTAVICYDLIPYIHRQIYLQNPETERWYLEKFDYLRNSDLILAISESTRQEVLEHLALASEKVATISTACTEQFKPMSVDAGRLEYLRQTYGLIRPFVMYTGGIDHRKNIEGLIRAYAMLPRDVRLAHQLAIVCSAQPSDRDRLQGLARKEGLDADELIITGFVPEDDLLYLYNTCKLFVFPSWHEGFGIPALEAMSCGRAVIGSNVSSLPEVIGRDDALFDPYDDSSISSKMLHVLTDNEFREELGRYGLARAKEFSWEKTAERAWKVLNAFLAGQKSVASLPAKKAAGQLRLAYLSPLPPEKSGISDYSAELLPFLAKHYEIDVIIEQNAVSDSWINGQCRIRGVEWFRGNAHLFDRILYHFGNSSFHSHMFDLLEELPGVVVLHDFFLSGVVHHLNSSIQNFWEKSLLASHGWTALEDRYKNGEFDTVMRYPCNLGVLQNALGVIVHSENSKRLVRQWYGEDAGSEWAVIPLLRVYADKLDRSHARKALGLLESDFVVCSFGIMAPTKLNHRILSAWTASPLVKDQQCKLVFVGQHASGSYGSDIDRAIVEIGSRVEITGWVDTDVYRLWLEAADVAVQLRTLSRGETSAAVLDCMNHGLATIVNANGSMADLPDDCVVLLPDEFSDDQLADALVRLREDVNYKIQLGEKARERIYASHNPAHCAELYHDAIERIYGKASTALPNLCDEISNVEPNLDDQTCCNLSTLLAENFPPNPRQKQLFLDISELVQRDVGSEIQRVVKALLNELLLHPPAGWSITPVYATSEKEGYHYAHRFVSRILGIQDGWAEDRMIDVWPGDVFLGLDLQPTVVSAQANILLNWHLRGVKVLFVVYDLICIKHPEFFVKGEDDLMRRWLGIATRFDGAVCISRSVANELTEWIEELGAGKDHRFRVDWFHLGADIKNSFPTKGLPKDAEKVLNKLSKTPSFLMVGTIEPKKSHEEVLEAFELLWEAGINANLVIVGNHGWMREKLTEKIRTHSEFGNKLFWLDGISDEYLEKIYAAATGLIAASHAEGFGLPLIEAAQHGLPIIARDIPVFREVAGEHAFYFKSNSPQELAEAIRSWMSLLSAGKAPDVAGMKWRTWSESARQLLDSVLGADIIN